jgi:multidrug efflux pump subunit AcrA (membrane-fusion protein)
LVFKREGPCRQDLTQTVTANGEIKTRKLRQRQFEHDGTHRPHAGQREAIIVNSGDLLIRLESVQTESDVTAAQASLDAAQAELEGMDASTVRPRRPIHSARLR